jgi:signal recognition particle receptor subunit beta
MVQINFALREVNCKVVYYGPGMSGKTTNLEVVHQKAPEQHKGELTSISTDGDRTLFFDFMPLDLGTIAGMRTKFQLYTVPGQVYYNSTRKLVLQGVDGVIFVADSDPTKMAENIESLNNLEENLREYGKELKELPHVIQFNKRDLPEVMSAEEMSAQLNRFGAPTFEAVAPTGQGVFPTLKVLAGLVLQSINKSDRKGVRVGGKPAAGAAASPRPDSAGGPQAESPSAPVSREAEQAPAAPVRPAAAAAASADRGRAPARRSAPAPRRGSTATAAERRTASAPAEEADLKSLMRNQRAAQASPRKAPQRQTRRRQSASSARQARSRPAQKSGGNLIYGMVFALLVAAVAAVVALYVLQ